MKKEAIIAIVTGLVLGLIITFGIYTANQALEKQKAKKQEQAQTQASPPPTANADKQLTITSPEPNDLFNQSEISLSGIAWSDAVIAIITENEELLLVADQEGAFITDLTLVKGFNEITVIASDELTEPRTKNLIVTYSTTDIELETNQTTNQ